MKKLLLLVLLLLWAIISFEQTTINPNGKSDPDYFTKSKKQRTAAWIFLGGGFVLTASGFVIGLSSAATELVEIIGGEKSNTFEAGAVLFFTGTAAMLGSIPLFIASSKNKRKSIALSASFKIDKTTYISHTSINNVFYPALSLRLNLRCIQKLTQQFFTNK